MAEQKVQMVHKVTFAQPDGTEKSVLIRPIKIKDQQVAAAQASRKCGKGAGDLEIQVTMQQELLKLILVAVNDTPLTGVQKEDLDSVLSYAEYNGLLKVVEDLQGNVTTPKLEMIQK